MDYNIIRSIIFLVAGLICIIFPKQLYSLKLKSKFYLVKRFNIKNKWFISNYEREHDVLIVRVFGIIFLIVSLMLYIISIIY